eukprot:NODE_16511_length_990_cov_8.288528.p1 GENE.NODE_16511_length_990_cov_8.288528~~NODE_16511_length_990_cov_8.288528.p1  ORF type:complete len:271 (-),score=63.80 NODE_16511_length_990_cov_8.288528:54-866(-)
MGMSTKARKAEHRKKAIKHDKPTKAPGTAADKHDVSKMPNAERRNAVKKANKRRRLKELHKIIVSVEEKARLEKEALKEIRDAVSEPASQKNGLPFIPTNWCDKYRGALGNYKKFVLSQPSLMVIEGNEEGKFTIGLVRDDGLTAGLAPWQVTLRGAWQVYKDMTPQTDRSVDHFISGLREDITSVRCIPATVTPALTEALEAAPGSGAATAITLAKVESPDATTNANNPKTTVVVAKKAAVKAEEVLIEAAQPASEANLGKKKKKQKLA